MLCCLQAREALGGGPSGGVVPVLLGGDLNCGPDSPCFAQFPHGGFVDLDTLPPHGPRLRFTMHVPRAPVPKLTDARRWEDPVVTGSHPVRSDYVLGLDLHLASCAPLDTGVHAFVPSGGNGLPRVGVSASDHFPVAYQVELVLAVAGGEGAKGRG